MAKSAQITEPPRLGPPAASFYRRGRFAGWACAYAVAVVYVSVVLGPAGLHFVPADPAAAWRMLLATPYLASGSDQRPDWVANLLMLIPLGFVVTGALWPHRGRVRRWLAAGAALCCCVVFVVAVKYAQLFFPPRTVSLNYILAQSFGSLLGVALFALSWDGLSALPRQLARGGRRPLVLACEIYTLALVLFFLFPFDLALSVGDLRGRAAVLPHLLLAWPGTGRPAAVRIGLVLAGTAATVPLGVLLALRSRRKSLLGIAAAGCVLMSAVTVLSLFVLSTAPSLAEIPYRTAGIVVGAVAARRFEGQDPARWRLMLARLVPLTIPPYLAALALVNGLLSPHWRTVPEALAAFDGHGLLPFYHEYIVAKAHAAQSVAVQAICFAPIGVMIALRGGDGRRGRGHGSIAGAASIAFVLSLAIEMARWFKPGLQPDFSNAIIAALAAGLAVRLTALFWRLLEGRPIAAQATGATECRGGSAGYRVSGRSAEAPFRESGQTGQAAALARLGVALTCLSAAGIVAADYPLAPWLLGAALAVYGAALWRWPSLWLAVVPAVLPAFDLTPWTGWTLVGEPDLFSLVTIGVLTIRAPPRRADFLVRGLPAAVLVLTLASYAASGALGLALPGPPGGSDNPYLRPDNALRLAKGFVTALALLPFLRQRLRTRGDAMVWLGGGMAAGLALVALAAMAERAVFPGLFDFTSDYRVVATFSGMHIGGGYIGAYIAMALPFVLVFALRLRVLPLLAMFAVAACASYALIVTFARTAYAAASLSILTACLGWALAARRRAAGARALPMLPAVMLVSIGGILAAGVATPFMTERVQRVSPDFASREGNWKEGLALRDGSAVTALFGVGLGTYPRVVLARKPNGHFPANFVVEHDGAYSFLALSAGSPTYFGQKVAIVPDEVYRVFLALRSPDGKGRLSLLLCEKLLLYSENCRGAEFVPRAGGEWEDFGAALSTAGFGRQALFGWLARPVELSLFDPVPGSRIEIGHVRLFGPHDRDVMANGDFSRGTERWYFTDDEHGVWRIFNQYLMSLFEGGVLGLVSLILLAGTALAGAARAIGRGERMGAMVLGSLLAFLCSGLFDHLLAVPRLATLFYLIAFCGLTMLQAPIQERASAEPPGAEPA